MIPINQVILGGDPLLGNSIVGNSLDEQLQLIEKYNMMTIMQLTENLKSYISLQLESMAKTNPMIGFMRPLIIRALDKNFSKVSKALDLIADKDGNIDIENILTEMMENLMTTNPFTFKTSFIGDIEIGGGEIRFNLPLTNKRLVLNTTDLETFKEMVITKN
jgi:hypothetical protein